MSQPWLSRYVAARSSVSNDGSQHKQHCPPKTCNASCQQGELYQQQPVIAKTAFIVSCEDIVTERAWNSFCSDAKQHAAAQQPCHHLHTCWSMHSNRALQEIVCAWLMQCKVALAANVPVTADSKHLAGSLAFCTRWSCLSRFCTVT